MCENIKIMFICGAFSKVNEKEVIEQSKKGVEFSANQIQLKFIEAFRHAAPTEVISAPFIGHYPNQSRTLHFHGFTKAQSLCKYVHFNNIWGISNISRTCALKKAVRDFALRESGKKLIVVYSAHYPFLAAAVYAKKLNQEIQVCCIIPDLPQYMNLEQKRGVLYDFFKKLDVKSIEKEMDSVDTSVVLTDAMAHILHLNDRPYIVSEGIVESLPQENSCDKQKETVNIVYAGKVYFKFGIKLLLDAFSKFKNTNYRLVICGTGDAAEYVKKCAKEDHRITFTGQLSPDEVQRYINSATVLVNPRPNNEEYTKYSFPSKDIEYLLSGKPTVAFILDGMPDCYRDFIYAADRDKDPVSAIFDALKKAVIAPEEEVRKRHMQFLEYTSKNLLASEIVRKIIEVNFDQEV